MLGQKIYKIKDSVDVYKQEVDQKIKLQFYKINTREKTTIIASHYVSDFVAELDGKSSVDEILFRLGCKVELNELNALCDFLLTKRLIVESLGEELLIEDFAARYTRQINFFEDWVEQGTGLEAQKKLKEANVVILGAGAIGSAIAISLARAGVGSIRLIDYKRIDEKCSIRHYYFSQSDIGELKTTALAAYLKRLNRKINVVEINAKIIPSTDVMELIGGDADLVVNTADEPYIGHITIKIGRALWSKGIPLYVAGGFDAHLMSTGEFVIPGVTPCTDCYSAYFSKTLKDWKPTYIANDVRDVSLVNVEKKLKHFVGGAGGLASMSLFSASFASIQIIRYLLGGLSEKYIQRGEYLINSAKIIWVNLASDAKGDCHVCGK